MRIMCFSSFHISSTRTWEPAQAIKRDDPVTFFRYVDRVGLAAQCECGSQSKLAGKAAWRNVLKDGWPSDDDEHVEIDNANDDDNGDGGEDEEMPLEDTKSTNKKPPDDS